MYDPYELLAAFGLLGISAFLWLTFAPITAIVAGSKGRNWSLWLLIAVVFGPFAFFTVAAMPKIEGAEADRNRSIAFWCFLTFPIVLALIWVAVDRGWIP